jgi:hypothetical protein
LEQTEAKVEFDPNSIDLNSPNISVRAAINDVNHEGTIKFTTAMYVDWVRNYDLPSDADEVRPEWADLPWKERIIMDVKPGLAHSIASFVVQGRVPGAAKVQLPCPPYEFTQDGGRLRIEKQGVFHEGTKQDWEGVIEDMQAAVEEMPNGIDITSMSVGIDVTREVTYYIRKDVTDLIGDSDQLDNDGMWIGTESELESALEDALSDLQRGWGDTYQLDHDGYGDYQEGAILSAEYEDLSYDISNS